MRARHFSARIISLAGLALLVGKPAIVPAAEIRLRSDTLVRAMERDIGGVKDRAVVPGYEYLQIDAGQLSSAGVSFHSYGWGRFDFADNDFFEDRSDGELLYGYLRYADPANGLDIRAGRQYIAAGVGNDAIDGLSVGGVLGTWLVASAYGGQAVGFASTEGRNGDSIYGGRLGFRQSRYGELAASYKILDNNDITAEETLGVDLAFFLPAGIDLLGFSSRNLDSKGWAEHAYELRIPVKAVSFRPHFGQFDYEHYFGTGVNTVNPFRVLAINGEKLRVMGLDTSWRHSEALEFGLKLKGNDYDRKDASSYASGLAVWHGDKLTQTGLEIGYMNGDLDRQKYLLARLHGYLDGLAGTGFVSGDVIWVCYDQPIHGEDNSLVVSLGAGRAFWDEALEIKLSGDYSRDPYFDSDVRGLLAVTFRYDHKP